MIIVVYTYICIYEKDVMKVPVTIEKVMVGEEYLPLIKKIKGKTNETIHPHQHT